MTLTPLFLLIATIRRIISYPKLNGSYLVSDLAQKECLNRFLTAVDNSIKYMKKADCEDKKQKLAAFLVGKAIILTRSGIGDKKSLSKLLKDTSEIIRSELNHTPENVAYLFSCAWYCTYIDFNRDNAVKYVNKAFLLAKEVFENKLEFIDNSIIPAANVLYEIGYSKQAKELIIKGIKICDKNKDIIPYMRRRNDLYNYLLDIYSIEGNKTEYEQIKSICDNEKNNF